LTAPTRLLTEIFTTTSLIAATVVSAVLCGVVRTEAMSPQAMQQIQALLVEKAARALTSTALDIEAPGFDRDSGFGLLDAFAAAQSGPTPPSPMPTATGGSSQTPTTGATPPGLCVGDCNTNGTVTIDELIAGVNIALGVAQLSLCPQFDCNGTSHVTVDCLVKAVNSALNGCVGGG
jgi:hypothetical protein